jgi:hypothetical protein
MSRRSPQTAPTRRSRSGNEPAPEPLNAQGERAFFSTAHNAWLDNLYGWPAGSALGIYQANAALREDARRLIDAANMRVPPQYDAVVTPPADRSPPPVYTPGDRRDYYLASIPWDADGEQRTPLATDRAAVASFRAGQAAARARQRERARTYTANESRVADLSRRILGDEAFNEIWERPNTIPEPLPNPRTGEEMRVEDRAIFAAWEAQGLTEEDRALVAQWDPQGAAIREAAARADNGTPARTAGPANRGRGGRTAQSMVAERLREQGGFNGMVRGFRYNLPLEHEPEAQGEEDPSVDDELAEPAQGLALDGRPRPSLFDSFPTRLPAFQAIEARIRARSPWEWDDPSPASSASGNAPPPTPQSAFAGAANHGAPRSGGHTTSPSSAGSGGRRVTFADNTSRPRNSIARTPTGVDTPLYSLFDPPSSQNDAAEPSTQDDADVEMSDDEYVPEPSTPVRRAARSSHDADVEDNGRSPRSGVSPRSDTLSAPMGNVRITRNSARRARGQGGGRSVSTRARANTRRRGR